MKLDDTTYELIENFLLGNLPPGEADKVRRRVEEDPAFAEEVAWMKDFLGMMKNQQGAKVLDVFREIHQKRKKTRKRRQLVYVLAGAVAALLLIIWFFPLGLGPEAPEPVAEISPAGLPWEAFVEYEEGLQRLGIEEDSLLESALILIDNDRPAEALPLLETYLSNLPKGEDDLDMRLLAGKICLKEEHNYERAAFHFTRIAQNDDVLPTFKKEARFYLALTDLAGGEEAPAKATLRDLAAQEEEPWKSEAARVLETLE
jgi:hypothetical protein